MATYDATAARAALANAQAKRRDALAREQGRDLEALPKREKAASELLAAFRAVITETDPLNRVTGDESEMTIWISVGPNRQAHAFVRRTRDRIEISPDRSTWERAAIRYDGALDAFVGQPDALAAVMAAVVAVAR